MMRLVVSLRPLKCGSRFVTAFFFLLAALIFPAAAEPAPSPSAQFDELIEWGGNTSAPPGGSSIPLSEKPINGSNDQQGTDGLIEWDGTTSAPPASSDTSTGSSSPSAPAQDAAPESSPPAPLKVLVVIDKSTQEMKVFVDSVERYTWEVSTGLRGYDTPSGQYTARSMNEIWYSKQWDDAPMPHAIFFTEKGHAVHGTNETKNLGKPASHGCVRLAPENARALFALVKEKGLENTEIVLNGDTPKIEVASAGARKQEARQVKKSSKTVQKGHRPSGTAKTARSRPHKQIKPPRKFVDRFDPRDFDRERRFAPRDWARVYPPPRMLPPPDYYLPPPGRRFFIPEY
jgi:lipoprotein-anchoring transpeptidase ErfK/SrfK